MFIGLNSKTADYPAFLKAQEEKAKGTSNETIRQNLGWFQGMDGRWRYEIDDSKAKIFNLKDGDCYEEEENVKISHILKHDALFTAYPELKNYLMDVNLCSDEEIEPGGYFDPENKVVKVTENSIEGFKKALFHEVEHFIQEKEGFSTGGVPGSIKRQITEEFEKHIEISQNKYCLIPFPLIMAYKEVQKSTCPGDTILWEQYNILAAEIEARDVSFRTNLTAAERKTIVPNLQENAIVVFNGKEHIYTKPNFLELDNFIASNMLIQGRKKQEIEKLFSAPSLANPARNKTYATNLVNSALKDPNVKKDIYKITR